MVDAETGSQLVNWAVGGGTAGFAFFLARTILFVAVGRLKEREASIDAGTKFLIEQLRAEVDLQKAAVANLSGRLQQVEEHHAACIEELSKLRGYFEGRGDAQQHAQLIIAAEKQKEKP